MATEILNSTITQVIVENVTAILNATMETAAPLLANMTETQPMMIDPLAAE